MIDQITRRHILS